jgi:hypothetical protein
VENARQAHLWDGQWLHGNRIVHEFQVCPMHPSCFRVVRKILKQDCWSVLPIVHRAKTRPYQRNVISASMASPEAMQNYAISMPHIILLIENIFVDI